METFIHQFFQQLINGVSLGSIYALIALGYTMIYGIIKLINFAHGDIYMLGAYFGFFATTQLGLPFIPAIIFSMAGAAIAGIIIERVAYRPMRNEPRILLPGIQHDSAGFSAAENLPRCIRRYSIPSWTTGC